MIANRKEVAALKIGRPLFVILCAWALLLALPLYAAAEESEEYLLNGNIYYEINERDEIVITRSRASVTEAVIPAEIDGFPVTEIQNNAFQEHTRLRKVQLPDTIRKIGDYAFYQCTRLEEVEIPETVAQIGWGILTKTPWIQNQPEGCVLVGNGVLIGYAGASPQVVIPDGTTAIAGRAFEACTFMQSVQIPGTVKEIGGLAFSGCTQLTECTIPEGVTSIGEYAFNWCVALQNVRIADSVTEIDNHAFIGCSGLISVTLPKGLTKIGSAVFCGCSNLTKIEIPAFVTEIGVEAFYGCISLTEVTLRSAVQTIGAGAFSGCTSLRKVTMHSSKCSIDDAAETFPEASLLYGLPESSLQFYAQKYSRQFIEAEPLLGDMDEDGSLTVSDASLLLTIFSKEGAGVQRANAFQLWVGDVNYDGAINVSDATWVLTRFAQNAAGMDVLHSE